MADAFAPIGLLAGIKQRFAYDGQAVVPYFCPSPIGSDAAGRARVSTVQTIFDGKTLNADDSNLWQSLGTGTGLWTENLYSMSVTAGQYYIRRGQHSCPYFSGKPQLIEMTFSGFNAETGVTKRAGYFTSNTSAPYQSSLDGIWLENDGIRIRFVGYNNGTESFNIPIESWDGYSSVQSYDWSKFTVILIDFLWLGGAVARLSLKTQNGFVLCHTINWAGSQPGLIMLSPAKSVRYDIVSSTGSGSMKAVCSQVSSEGTTNEVGEVKAIINYTGISANAIGTIYALKGVKKSSSYRDLSVAINSVYVQNSSANERGMIQLYLNPTLSAPISYVANGRVLDGTATSQTITSGSGRLLYAFPSDVSGGASGLDTNFLTKVGMAIDNTSDEIVLGYMPVTTNQTVYGIMTLQKY